MVSKRLLILACSQRKCPDPGLLPAIERYDGPSFRVLRKFRSENPTEAKTVDIYILSAKFGLISASQPIPNYDLRMTTQQAQELHPQILHNLRNIIENQAYDESFIGLGKSYLQALDGYEQLIANIKLTLSKGSQGRRLAELRQWLYNRIPQETKTQKIVISQGKACIRGIEITLTPEQALNEARRFLRNGQSGSSTNYQSWYVPVDDRRVSPKWLVSQLTGLPVGSFHSGEARRVLEQLGIKPHKV